MMALLWLTNTALACPVCGGGGQNQQAFIDTMIFMSLLPLAMLGGVAFLFWRLSRSPALTDESATRPTGAAPPR